MTFELQQFVVKRKVFFFFKKINFALEVCGKAFWSFLNDLGIAVLLKFEKKNIFQAFDF